MTTAAPTPKAKLTTGAQPQTKRENKITESVLWRSAKHIVLSDGSRIDVKKVIGTTTYTVVVEEPPPDYDVQRRYLRVILKHAVVSFYADPEMIKRIQQEEAQG